jgi:hypothetical protein
MYNKNTFEMQNCVFKFSLPGGKFQSKKDSSAPPKTPERRPEAVTSGKSGKCSVFSDILTYSECILCTNGYFLIQFLQQQLR